MTWTAPPVLRRAAPVLVFVCAASWLAWRAVSDDQARSDEAEWITAGYRTYQLYRTGASPEVWERAYDELHLKDWGNPNPPVGKAVIGFAIASFRQDEDELRYRTHWPWVARTVEPPPPRHLLLPARLAISLSATACLLLVWLLSMQLTGRPLFSLCAPVMLVLLEAFAYHGSHVYTDAPQLAFLLAATVLWNRHLRTGNEWPFYAGLLVAGLACATKLSAGPAVLAALIFFFVIRAETRVRRLGRLLALIVIPFAAFVAVNPYLYPSPTDRCVRIVERWGAAKREQQQMPPLQRQAVTTRMRAAALVAVKGVTAPTFTPRIRSTLLGASIIGALVLVLVAFRRRLRPGRAIWWGAATACANAIAAAAIGQTPTLLLPFLAGAGAAHLLARLRQAHGLHRQLIQHYATVFLTFVVLTILWLPFDWSRYYLPVMIYASVLYPAGAIELANHVQSSRTTRTTTHGVGYGQ